MHHPLRALTASILLTSAVAACTETMPTGPGGRAAVGAAFNELSAAAAWNRNIRIGVVSSATSITIGAGGDDFTLRDDVTGGTLHEGKSDLTVTLEGSFVTIRRWRLQVMCASGSAVAARKAQAEAAGVVTFTEPFPTANCTRLYLGEFAPPPANTSAARTAFRNAMIAAGLAPSDAFYRDHTHTVGVSSYVIQAPAIRIVTLNPVTLTNDDGGLVTIGGQPYRGMARVIRNSGGLLAGVNELPIEQYLFGVVPRELPPVPYGEVEAQKAQAVAARTYALSGLNKRIADGYDLLATTSDQVYGGFAAEHPVSTRAVEETAGKVAVYKNPVTGSSALIEALFSSTSGGFTASNEEVFSSAPIPYLRAKPDAQRGSSLEHIPERAADVSVFKYATNARSLRGFKGGDYEADWSRYHRWTFEWTADEISDVVGDYAATLPGGSQDVGRVLAIEVLTRGPSGRVDSIAFVTEKQGTIYDRKDHIRSSLRFFNAAGAKSSLLSTLFYIEPVLDRKTGEVTGFVAYGGGWGHGVGLAQTGAVGMAEKGATFDEILRYYYTGIELANDYNGL